MNKEQQKDFSHRIVFLKSILVLSAALMLLRLFIISVGQHSYYIAQAESQHGYYQKLIPTRGEIFISDKYSQKPYPIATNSKKDLVYIVPQNILKTAETAETLARITNLDSTELLVKISDQSRKYIVIKKGLTVEESKAIAEAKLAGVFLDQENTRYYPEGQFLSQVLGFLGYKDKSDERTGLYGLEKYMQKELAGIPGEISADVSVNGAAIPGTQKQFTPAVDGTSLYLTIDRAIQFKAETVIRESVQKHGADSGTIIVADPKTGAILAMANFPSFDPNAYNKATTPAVYINDATTENYEPGSTMKTITMATGIDLGVVNPSTTYNDTGVVEVDGYKIKNSDGKASGVVPMTQVINQSLNTGAIFVQKQIGNERFYQSLKNFGFGTATNVELPEAIGNLSNLKTNITVNFYTAAFGQGITVTPLQMLQSYIPLANKGKLMQPYIIDSKVLPDGTVIKTEPKMLREVVSEKTATLISGMLVDNVENGHGKQAGVKGYYIGGKTGTAQVASGGVYVQNDNIGSFVGYGPTEDPRFVMIVDVKHPRDVKFAESTAAPAFGRMAEFILGYYDIPPTRK